jgi:hypothetical protein
MAARRTARRRRCLGKPVNGFPRRRGVSRDIAVERVTGIEPAQSAWKAWDSWRHLRWSTRSRSDVLPFACLNAVPMVAGRAASRFRSTRWQSSAAVPACNRHRRHSALGWLSPVEFDTQHKIIAV